MNICDQIIDMKRVQIQTANAVIEGTPINIDYAEDTGESEDAICVETNDGRIVSILEGQIKAFK